MAIALLQVLRGREVSDPARPGREDGGTKEGTAAARRDEAAKQGGRTERRKRKRGRREVRRGGGSEREKAGDLSASTDEGQRSAGVN